MMTRGRHKHTKNKKHNNNNNNNDGGEEEEGEEEEVEEGEEENERGGGGMVNHSKKSPKTRETERKRKTEEGKGGEGEGGGMRDFPSMNIAQSNCDGDLHGASHTQALGDCSSNLDSDDDEEEEDDDDDERENLSSYVQILQRRKAAAKEGSLLGGFEEYYDPMRELDSEVVQLPSTPFMELINSNLGTALPSRCSSPLLSTSISSVDASSTRDAQPSKNATKITPTTTTDREGEREGKEEDKDKDKDESVTLPESLQENFHYEDSSEDDEPIPPPTKETRARRKREVIILRKENKRLRKERNVFYRDIKHLEEQIEQRTKSLHGNTDPAVIYENDFLRNEIGNHRQFLKEFAALTQFQADRDQARKSVLKQGVETAQSYVLGLVAESTKWKTAVKPADVEIPLPELQFRYRFSDDVFSNANGNAPNANTSKINKKSSSSSSSSSSPTSSDTSTTTKRRLSLRVDALVPMMSSEHVCDIFWRALCNTDEHQRLYGTKLAELEPIETPESALPDNDTRIIRFRKKWKGSEMNQDTFFIANREKLELPKSTILLKKRGGKQQDQEDPGSRTHCDAHAPSSLSTSTGFGMTPVNMVSMSTTTLLPSDVTASQLLREDYPSSLGSCSRSSVSHVQSGKTNVSTATSQDTRNNTNTNTNNNNNVANDRLENSRIMGSTKGIEDMIIKGAITREDDDGRGTHFTVVYSVPEDYKIMDTVGFDSIIDKKNMMTTLFADILRNVAREFQVMLTESSSSSSSSSPSSSSLADKSSKSHPTFESLASSSLQSSMKLSPNFKMPSERVIAENVQRQNHKNKGEDKFMKNSNEASTKNLADEPARKRQKRQEPFQEHEESQDDSKYIGSDSGHAAYAQGDSSDWLKLLPPGFDIFNCSDNAQSMMDLMKSLGGPSVPSSSSTSSSSSSSSSSASSSVSTLFAPSDFSDESTDNSKSWLSGFDFN